MRRATPLLLCAWIAATAQAEDPAPSETAAGVLSQATAEIFGRFDHRVHDRALQRERIGCTACHQVGGAGDPRIPPAKLDAAYLPPPPGACHYCHNPPAGQREVGPGRCALCHDLVDPPRSHGAGWLELHGREMRVGALECEDCHRQAFCIDCHTRKERITYNVHDRTWMAVHGIAANTDPTCGTCHIQVECVACHTSAAGRLP